MMRRQDWELVIETAIVSGVFLLALGWVIKETVKDRLRSTGPKR